MHKNSYNLNHNDIIICIKDWKQDNGDIYFSKGTKYRIMMDGLYQTDNNEIFMINITDGMVLKSGCVAVIHYIKDDEFLNYFKIDIKAIRKEKLVKLQRKNK